MEKIVYAKRLCLATIMLLVFNLLLSSFSFAEISCTTSKDQKTKITLSKDLEKDVFVFEKESIEEEEELVAHATHFSHFTKVVFSRQLFGQKKQLNKEIYEYPIPRWLMIRHILI